MIVTPFHPEEGNEKIVQLAINWKATPFNAEEQSLLISQWEELSKQKQAPWGTEVKRYAEMYFDIQKNLSPITTNTLGVLNRGNESNRFTVSCFATCS